jgi:hypothetical protein
MATTRKNRQTQDLQKTAYLNALRGALKMLQDANISEVNGDNNRPVHIARDLWEGNNTHVSYDGADLLNAPVNQIDPFIGLVAKRKQIENTLARHICLAEEILRQPA